MLEAVTSEVELEEVANLKKRLLGWCVGTKAIRVIDYSVMEFPCVTKYPELYQVIQAGVLSQNNDVSEGAAHTIVTITKYSDYDDMDGIYRVFPGIFNNLLLRLMESPQT